MAITPVTTGAPVPTLPTADTSPRNGEVTNFGDTLRDLLGEVNGASNDANVAVSKMLDGTGDVHEAMIAMQRADTMLQLTVQIRNKLVQAYQDVMRMSV